MGFYSSHVFPRLIDFVMATENFSRIREDLLSEVRGNTLEIGFGTGLNLAHYPASLERLTAIDLNPGMQSRAAARVGAFRSEIDLRTLDGESLPFDDESFDSVVSTWTLCSIPNVGQALTELRRVLRKDGRFFFVEHGLSTEPNIHRWQDRLTPVQKKIADGCHLNRNIEQLVRDAGFTVEQLKTFYMENTPRVGGFLYQGVAQRSGK